MRRILRWALIIAPMLVLVAMAVTNLSPPRENRNASCINILRSIQSAKEQWALENNKTNSDVPTWTDLNIYFGRGGLVILKCPKAGAYTLGPVTDKPTCSYPGHVLP